jgi:phage terminase large subunit-like protein
MFNLDVNDLLNILDGEEFEERPVMIEEFCTSDKYLGLPPLSEYQYQMIKMATQIYRRDTLYKLYGTDLGNMRWAETRNEVIMQLGKGSGKDFCSTIACSYVVYLLLCLKDPQKYFGKPPGDAIDIINIAINADQATRVFFKGMVQRIKNSEWFQGRYDAKQNGEPAQNGEIHFDKNINLYSGHSEREAFEGYNTIFVVLDEIAGFAVENTTGNKQAKTAEDVYKMYAASVSSRFPDEGKLLLLSFPRYKGDFITTRYDQVVGAKEVIKREERLKINPDIPDEVEENWFTISWDEDHIEYYTEPGVFALKRPSWEVNPTKRIENYLRDYIRDALDAGGRFACMPPDAVDAFFKDRQKIETAFVTSNGVDDTGRFYETFQPKAGKRYFVHVDLARLHDHCAVAMAHVEKWERRKVGFITSEPGPVVVVDCVRYWTPSKTKSVDFADVREFIKSLKNRGFDVRLTTFDRWESADMMKYLNSIGMKSERLSVAKKHYEDMAMVVGEERLAGPHIQLLIDELLQLQIMKNDKVDHPRKGSKDLSDAVCGAIFNAISLTPRENSDIVEIRTWDDVKEPVRNTIKKDDGVIRAPGRRMAPELEDYLSKLSLL